MVDGQTTEIFFRILGKKAQCIQSLSNQGLGDQDRHDCRNHSRFPDPEIKSMAANEQSLNVERLFAVQFYVLHQAIQKYHHTCKLISEL